MSFVLSIIKREVNKNTSEGILKKAISFFGTVRYYFLSKPDIDTITIKYPESYYIKRRNRHEKQLYNECAGYSTAFLLRHFDKDMSGEKAYTNMKFKHQSSGYVMPKSIVEYLKTYNIECQIMKGNLETLKSRLALGNPLIVLIGQKFEWQHYVTIVGYDGVKKEIYVFDSLCDPSYDEIHCGNSMIKESDFLSLWNNGIPLLDHIYLAVK